jgi:hypothetical protein
VANLYRITLWLTTVAALELDGLPQASADKSSLSTIISILIKITGAICLLMITIGGLRYILSQGDPQGVAKAKGAIIYALVGLIIVLVAQAIVSFVLGGIK